MISSMNYSQKRTLAARVVYIALTLMAVTVLCITMFTFFSSRRNKEIPQIGTEPSVTEKAPVETKMQSSADVTDKTPANADTDVSVGVDTTDDVTPTDVQPAKDWTKLKVIMPVDGVIYRKHDPNTAVFSVTMNDYRIHQGVDIECSDSADVVACAYGKIKSVGYDSFMGNTVIIDHGDGLLSYYKNLSDELPEGIKAGNTVHAGQYIGAVSDSAIIEISDEPHLHFELELDGKQIDPMSMLDYKESAAVEGSQASDK